MCLGSRPIQLVGAVRHAAYLRVVLQVVLQAVERHRIPGAGTRPAERERGVALGQQNLIMHVKPRVRPLEYRLRLVLWKKPRVTKSRSTARRNHSVSATPLPGSARPDHSPGIARSGGCTSAKAGEGRREVEFA